MKNVGKIFLFRHKQANRPFPSSKKSHFQNEAKCEAIDMKMISYSHANKTHFHNTGFALSLVLKVRCFGTRKWPITPIFEYKYSSARNIFSSLMMPLIGESFDYNFIF